MYRGELGSFVGQLTSASKTLAERAFWKFIEEKKTAWDGATICPPMVRAPSAPLTTGVRPDSAADLEHVRAQHVER
jgi:hypothetical protein